MPTVDHVDEHYCSAVDCQRHDTFDISYCNFFGLLGRDVCLVDWKILQWSHYLVSWYMQRRMTMMCITVIATIIESCWFVLIDSLFMNLAWDEMILLCALSFGFGFACGWTDGCDAVYRPVKLLQHSNQCSRRRSVRVGLWVWEGEFRYYVCPCCERSVQVQVMS